VLARIRALFGEAGDLEVTVECNPTSLDRERAQALVEEGVNRLSIGTQSLRIAGKSVQGNVLEARVFER
jgi:oxygen-independent coproporphyrinogen-3 oxidase